MQIKFRTAGFACLGNKKHYYVENDNNFFMDELEKNYETNVRIRLKNIWLRTEVKKCK